MSITPVERRRLSDAVVDQITGLIASGVYPVGEKLPSERDLAERLGVSRTLVRESFRILESIGLVQVRPGVGAIVTANGPQTIDIATYVLNHPAEVLEVLEVREVLDARAAELAAQRITEKELAALERLIELQRAAVAAGDTEEMSRLDHDFHDRIYRAARNGVLVAIEQYTREVLQVVRWRLITLSTRAAQSIEEHLQITAAIRERSGRGAAAAARRHTRRANATIRKLAEERLGEREVRPDSPGNNHVDQLT